VTLTNVRVREDNVVKLNRKVSRISMRK